MREQRSEEKKRTERGQGESSGERERERGNKETLERWLRKSGQRRERKTQSEAENKGEGGGHESQSLRVCTCISMCTHSLVDGFVCDEFPHTDPGSSRPHSIAIALSTEPGPRR